MNSKLVLYVHVQQPVFLYSFTINWLCVRLYSKLILRTIVQQTNSMKESLELQKEVFLYVCIKIKFKQLTRTYKVLVS